ncbi:hypothetical protein [Methyloversatilis sp. XJ19-49]|uniref:hypothetical protein n=1 Tax=Methyloversatilis sp. XJ19-49 TaxID=2963429 RepID=UPI00211C8025|nr:hypothetical protein [Methyloversatilis sp. XJ19-49]MCQ9379157.1 hypothetical protein [Methyloversatilis sp. XJ19-49]
MTALLLHRTGVVLVLHAAARSVVVVHAMMRSVPGIGCRLSVMHVVILGGRVADAMVMRRRALCGRAGWRRMSRVRVVELRVCLLIRMIDRRSVRMSAGLPCDPVIGVTP